MRIFKLWTINRLHDALQADLAQCHGPHERDNVKAIGGREIRLTAEQIARHRPLIENEAAIARMYGWPQ